MFTEDMYDGLVNLWCFTEKDKWFRECEISGILKEAKTYAKIMYDNLHKLPKRNNNSVQTNASFKNISENNDSFSDFDEMGWS